MSHQAAGAAWLVREVFLWSVRRGRRGAVCLSGSPFVCFGESSGKVGGKKSFSGTLKKTAGTLLLFCAALCPEGSGFYFMNTKNTARIRQIKAAR